MGKYCFVKEICKCFVNIIVKYYYCLKKSMYIIIIYLEMKDKYFI